mgnify:CR=1 FL=1
MKIKSTIRGEIKCPYCKQKFSYIKDYEYKRIERTRYVKLKAKNGKT